MEELKFVCGEVALEHALPKSEALSIVICAELAMGCFLQHYRSQRDDPRKARSPYQCLIAKDVTGEYLLPALVWARLKPHSDKLTTMIGAEHAVWVHKRLCALGASLYALERQNDLRLRAEQIVQDKFQVLIGAQVLALPCACLRWGGGSGRGRNRGLGGGDIELVEGGWGGGEGGAGAAKAGFGTWETGEGVVVGPIPGSRDIMGSSAHPSSPPGWQHRILGCTPSAVCSGSPRR